LFRQREMCSRLCQLEGNGTVWMFQTEDHVRKRENVAQFCVDQKENDQIGRNSSCSSQLYTWLAIIENVNLIGHQRKCKLSAMWKNGENDRCFIHQADSAYIQARALLCVRQYRIAMHRPTELQRETSELRYTRYTSWRNGHADHGLKNRSVEGSWFANTMEM
jgi:hypothetical protein